MFVLGTAGHVDHGKSVLVHSLTGIDPDRLQEEKERGMTIDLGFAWLKLPSGREVSIVDVPGHERFIKNMLAGAGGIDVALLIVAADEGVMPQTREHLAILDLLGIEKGIVVITKRDLVDEEWLELVRLDVQELVAGTTLAESPIVAVSAVSGEGLDELISIIDSLLDSVPVKKDIGRPRLPVDRAFTIAGFGTVVTGTLLDGKLSLGQEVEILPQGLRGRLRGLQTHKQKVELALPGTRVAANLSGVSTSASVTKNELRRGDVLTAPGWLSPTKAIDGKLRLLTSALHPLHHNTIITFHYATTEVSGKVRLLTREKIEPGEEEWVQIVLAHPIAIVKGDHFIVRSPNETLGGGVILDTHVRHHRHSRTKIVQSLEARDSSDPQKVSLATLSEKQPLTLKKLALLCNFTTSETERIIHSLIASKEVIMLPAVRKEDMLLFSVSGWTDFAERIKQAVEKYHHQFPLRPGMPMEELKGKMMIPFLFFTPAFQQLIGDNVLAQSEAVVQLPDFEIQLTPSQQESVDLFLESLNRNPYSPLQDLLLEQDLLELLIRNGKVVKVSNEVVFISSAYDKMREGIISLLESQGKITLGEVRDLLHTSRKYALAMLQHLDEEKITIRDGNDRMLYKHHRSYQVTAR